MGNIIVKIKCCVKRKTKKKNGSKASYLLFNRLYLYCRRQIQTSEVNNFRLQLQFKNNKTNKTIKM